MAAAVNKNNAYSTLAGSLTNVATSMTVGTGHGDRFPIVTAPDWAMVTLADAAGNIEIVKVTARASAADTMTIVRAQEGTTAQAWDIGDIVELRPTAGTMATVDGTQTLTNKSLSGAANTFTNIPTSALVVVSAIKTFLDAATLLAARAALGLTSIGEALATAASAAAARSAIGAADSSTVVNQGAVTTSGLTMSTARMLGRSTGGTGAVEERTADQVAAFLVGYIAPVGTIIDFAGTSAPTGYLACPTSATNVSRTTYAALFAAIGTTWGAGDGSTTFGLPWFPADYTAVQANANVGTPTTGDVKAHTHTAYGGTNQVPSLGPGATIGVPGSTTGSTGGSANLAAGHRVLKCVKFQ